MSLPEETTEYVNVRASLRLGDTRTAVHIPYLPSALVMPGTSLLSMLSSMKSGAHARADLYISKKAVLAVTGPAGASCFGAASVLVSGVVGASEQAARSRTASPAVVSASQFLIMLYASSVRGRWGDYRSRFNPCTAGSGSSSYFRRSSD